jgi:hypothetical protein
LRRRERISGIYVYQGDDDGLREALRAYDAFARSEAAYARRRRRRGEWRAFSDARTWSFVNSGDMLEYWERIPGFC